jgi:diketogulonate reductase-like aldo/keto reductase
VGSVPVRETLETFQSLKRAGKVRDYGVSNFDKEDMEEAMAFPGGDEIATDQVLYNLKHRGIEWDLLPWCRERGIPIMAYSPIQQGKLLKHKQLGLIASRCGATPAQVALAWVLRQDVVAIPKASNLRHLRENRAALDLVLANDELAELARDFPPPRKEVPLEMI